MTIQKKQNKTRLPRNAFLEKQLQTQWSKRSTRSDVGNSGYIVSNYASDTLFDKVG